MLSSNRLIIVFTSLMVNDMRVSLTAAAGPQAQAGQGHEVKGQPPGWELAGTQNGISSSKSSASRQELRGSEGSAGSCVWYAMVKSG